MVASQSQAGARLAVTPSGFVQGLCAGSNVWNEASRVFAHLKEEMPNLVGSWSTIIHASRKTALGLLEMAVRLTVNGRDWFTGNAWEAFERNYVLALCKSVEITNDERQRIVVAARDDVRTREYFVRVVRQLSKRKEITPQECRQMTLVLRTPPSAKNMVQQNSKGVRKGT